MRGRKLCSAARQQANRRNVTKEEARLLRGREYNAAKKDSSKNLAKTSNSSGGQNDHQAPSKEKTSTELAKKHGVGEKTIRRDAVRAELHDAVKEADPKAPGSLLQSELCHERP